MPESGAVQRVRDAMNVWLYKGLPADFRQLYVDMKHIIGCLPASVKPEETMDNPNIRRVYHKDGHVTVSCKVCGWDADSRIHEDWNHQTETHASRCAATVPAPVRTPPPVAGGDRTPVVGDAIHYRSYGTPNGEYMPACRAATVTAVGEWVTVETAKASSYSPSEGRPIRTQEQWLYDDAVSLAVSNPDGIFLKGAIRHDENKTGGTWHWPCNG